MQEAAVGEKATDPQRVVEASVQVPPPDPGEGPPPQSQLIQWIPQVADEVVPWGTRPKLRDEQLREFASTESIFTSGLGIVSARNAAFTWLLEGPAPKVAESKEVLDSANFGKGWTNFILRVSQDLYTQDHGAFIELIRENNASPDAPLLGIANLDAAKCWHTGHPEAPVIYQDRLGRYHLLNWWQVATLSEMPTTDENWPGLQYCALTRMLLAAQVTKFIGIYRKEKTGGRFTNAIHLVRGMMSSEIQDAVNQVKMAADQRGLTKYINPVIVGSVDPSAPLDTKTLELSSLPEGFDEDKQLKWYIAQMAMAFLEDYQTFAPLMSTAIGSGAQSAVLHLKSRGKGPGLFMKLIMQSFNYFVLPDSVQMSFEEADLEEEAAEAEVSGKRAETRSTMVASGEMDADASRQMALDDGDISQEVFDMMGGTDATRGVTVADQEKVGTKELAPLLDGLGTKEAATVGEFLQTRIHRTFTMSADDLAALGYMDTEGRIKLSSVIGTVLRDLEQEMGKRVKRIVDRNLKDEDARGLVLMLAEKSLASEVAGGYVPFGWAASEKADRRAGPFEDERLENEDRLTAAVAKAFVTMFNRVKKRLSEASQAGGFPFIGQKDVQDIPVNLFDGDSEFWDAAKGDFVQATLGPTQEALTTGAQQAAKLGLAVSFDQVNQQVLDFTSQFTDDWWDQLQRTTSKQLRAAILANQASGASLRSLTKALEPTFGKARAEAIASTETTRMFAEGNRIAYADAGIEETVWRTVSDARVDPICDRLEGKRQKVNQEEFVPPVHVRCRCWLAPVANRKILDEKV